LQLFGRGKALRLIEEGLVWKAGGLSQMPDRGGRGPEGVLVEIPAFADGRQRDCYIAAIGLEAGHLLLDARPKWVQLRGAGLQAMPCSLIREVADAACPGAVGLGLELNPRLLGPGDIAGYRAIGVERFCFRMESPYDRVDDPVRRARALGAFASVEVCYSDELNWLTFMHAVGRALESAPSQVSIFDERRGAAAGSEQMEAAAERIAKAGYRRLSLWAWAKANAGFDRMGLQLAGLSAGVGPGAFTGRPQAYRNPDFQRWLETRLGRDYEVITAEGGLEHWLALASGLYALELRRRNMDFRAHRQATALERMGFVDKQGRPAAGRPMEFCHRAARLALHAMAGGPDAASAGAPPNGPGANSAEGMNAWKTGSSES
jgi:hypothetical protein